MSPAPSPAAPQDARIVVSIVNYGAADMVAAALAPLLDELSRFAAHAVLIVDNDSPEGAPGGDGDRLAAHLRRLGDPSVRLIRSARNGGFAAGNNLAFAALANLDWTPDAVLLLNPDAVIRPGALREMVRVMGLNPRIGVVGARLERPDGSSWVAAFRFPSMMGEFARETGLSVIANRWPILIPDTEIPVRADWVSGAAMLMRTTMLEEIGGMDEGYFLYFEETDFMLQAARAGWETWHAPEARVMHDAGSTTGIGDGRPLHGPMPAYWFASWRRYFAKNHGAPYAAATAVLKLCGMALGTAQRRLRRMPTNLPPGFVGMFARRCVLGANAADAPLPGNDGNAPARPSPDPSPGVNRAAP